MRDYQAEPMKFQFTLVINVDDEEHPADPAELKDVITDAFDNLEQLHFILQKFEDALGHECTMYYDKLTIKMESNEQDNELLYGGKKGWYQSEEPIKFYFNMGINVHGAIEPAVLKSIVKTVLIENIDFDHGLLEELSDVEDQVYTVDKLTFKMISDWPLYKVRQALTYFKN